LRRIGSILHISPSRKAVIKTAKPPKIGETLYDESRKPVGKVHDVFGPIRSPYIEVNIEDREPSKLVGRMLYTLPSKRRRRGRMRR